MIFRVYAPRFNVLLTIQLGFVLLLRCTEREREGGGRKETKSERIIASTPGGVSNEINGRVTLSRKSPFYCVRERERERRGSRGAR